MQVFLPTFLRSDYWERKGNIPALTLLLQAYLQRAAPALAASGRLPPVLGIFQKLLSVPRHYAEAYALLAALLAYAPLPQMQEYLPQVFKLLFTVLTGPRKSTKNSVAFIVTVCKLIAWHGAAPAAAAMDGAQAGSALAILSQVVPNNLAHVAGREERRAVRLGVARTLGELPALLAVRFLPPAACWLFTTQPTHGCTVRHVCANEVQQPCVKSLLWSGALTQTSAMQNGQQWLALLQAVLEWHSAVAPATAAAVADNTALAESLHEMMEFSNEFSKLACAHVPPPPVCPQARLARTPCCHASNTLQRCLQHAAVPFPCAPCAFTTRQLRVHCADATQLQETRVRCACR
jgi:CAS/CSE protein, C-terminus